MNSSPRALIVKVLSAEPLPSSGWVVMTSFKQMGQILDDQGRSAGRSRL